MRLPLSFDPALLARDLTAAESLVAWERHFNQAYYFGEWSGIALRGNSPNRFTLMIDPSRPDGFVNLPPLDACPYVRKIVDAIQAPIRSVRFLKVAPDGGIREHNDAMVGIDFDELRLHIPVLTNPGVEFKVGGEIIPMQAGECWYVNVHLPHSVMNRGGSDRVHLVFDAAVNDWLRARILGD